MITTGAERILVERPAWLRRHRIGIIAHAASVNRKLQSVVHQLMIDPEVRLKAVLGPQHGFHGETQDNMIEWQSYRDPNSGIPVFSLYGESRRPTAEMLHGVDLLLFDLQDVGARYYTFIWTMALAMQACRERGILFVVLDRPNPLGGIAVEGPVLDSNFTSFVGLYPLPIRHSMTVAEIAQYLNENCDIGCQLRVIPMIGWKRDTFFEETRLPWIMPSPNMPTPDTAFVYPGTCLLEGTNVSEGRGTTRPFELSGAPWIRPEQLVERLSDFSLPGTSFRPVRFRPTFHKWADQDVGGVQIHVTDRKTFQPFRTGLALTILYRELGKESFQWRKPPYEYEYEKLPFDILCGTDTIRKGIEDEAKLSTLEESWGKGLDQFQSIRVKYLLY